MASTSTRPRYFGWTAALIVLAGLVLRVWALGRASLWYDEIVTELYAQAPFSRFFTMVLEIGNHMPLYFALMHLFPTSSELWLRLPSALVGVAGIVVLMGVTVRLYKNYDLALIAGGLLAFNPYHIWLSRTARPYALLFVVSLLASYYFLLLLRGERTPRNWWLFTGWSMITYMTHYPSMALPLAQYILFAFILTGNRGFFRRWVRAQIVAGIPVVIWVIALMRQEHVAFGIGWIPRPGPQDIVLTLWNMLVGYDGTLPWYVVPGLIAAAVGLGYGLYLAVRERKSERANFYWFWLIVAPLALGFGVSLFRPLYVDRYFMVFLPALILLTVQGWMRFPLLQPRGRVGLAAVVMVVGLASVLVTLQQGREEKEDWRSVTAYIAAQRQPGDGVLVEEPFNLVIFRRYSDDTSLPGAWLADGPPLSEQFPTSIRRVWAIYRNPNEDGHVQGVLPDFNPFKLGSSPMPDWLIPRRAQVIAQQEFNGVTVLLVDVSAGLGVSN
jgi:uncharacterized membrane protein